MAPLFNFGLLGTELNSLRIDTRPADELIESLSGHGGMYVQLADHSFLRLFGVGDPRRLPEKRSFSAESCTPSFPTL